MKKTVVITFVYILCVQKTHSINHTATIGQDVQIPCGIHTAGDVTRLVWKFGQSANDSVQLAFIYGGSSGCDNRTKDCELNDNGDLVIHNVKETDGNDRYFCFLNDEKYYAEHILNIHPEVTCPSLAAVTNGVTPTCTNGNAGGSICNYQCNTGFEIRPGSVSRTCSSAVTGTWSGTEPTCVQITCPSLAAVTIGVTPTCTNGNAGGSICNYQCNTGFEIRSGSVSRTCSSVTGTWSGTEPTCVQTNRSVPCSCASVTTGRFFLGLVVGFIIESVLVLFIYKWYRRRKKEHTKPQFTTRLELQMTAIQGQMLELTCSVNGQTTPTILWYKDGKHLDSQAGYNTTLLDGVAKLTFPSIRGSDEGLYSCIVVNPAGDDITSCNVAVTGTTQADNEIMQQNSIQQDSAPPDTTQTDGTIIEDAVSEETPLAPQDTTPTDEITPQIVIQQETTPHTILDGNMQGGIRDCQPQFAGMKELVVEGDTPKFRILPSVAKPSDGIEVGSRFRSYLDFYIHRKDEVPIPKMIFDEKRFGLSTNVAQVITLPVHITCRKCGESCCLLEVYGDKCIN